METIDIIASIIGIFTTAVSVLALQLKSMRYVLICQISANVLLCVQYSLQGTLSAGGVIILAIVQALISYILSSRGVRFPTWLTAIFIVGYTAITALCYSSPFDIVTCVAVWLFAIAVIQTRSYIYRALLVGNSMLWLIYDIFVAPSAIVTHVVILVFSIVGILRLDIPEWRRIFGKGKTEK